MTSFSIFLSLLDWEHPRCQNLAELFWRAMLDSLCPEIKPKTTYSIRAKLNSHITVLAKCYWNQNSREDFQTKFLWKSPMKPFSMFDAIFFLDFTFKFLAGTFSILSGKMWKRKTELRFSRHWNRECIF